MFWKKSEAKTVKPEPTEEQLREEREYAEKNRSRRSTSGETTQILQRTFGAVDRSIEETRTTKEAAKRLQETTAMVGAQLRLKKA